MFIPVCIREITSLERHDHDVVPYIYIYTCACLSNLLSYIRELQKLHEHTKTMSKLNIVNNRCFLANKWPVDVCFPHACIRVCTGRFPPARKCLCLCSKSLCCSPEDVCMCVIAVIPVCVVVCGLISVSTPNSPDLLLLLQSLSMEPNHKSGDGLAGMQKEAALRTLIQRTGYQILQVGRG